MNQKILLKASIFGIIAVIFGALGAHALKQLLTPEQLSSFETGVRYQIYHAIVLLFLSLTTKWINEKAQKTITFFFFWGVILFSGSIYILTLKNILNIEVLKFAGPITPIGGILLMIGWLLLVKEAFKTND